MGVQKSSLETKGETDKLSAPGLSQTSPKKETVQHFFVLGFAAN